MYFSRRNALGLALGLWAKAEQQAHQHGTTALPSISYRMKFLTPSEASTLNRFAALMIPASEHSGGAAAAHVEVYIDHTLASAAPSLQRTWRRGLANWAKAPNTDSTLAALAPNEFNPRTPAEQFFVLFKSALTASFYTSEEGIIKELGYRGMAYLKEFPGYQGEAFVTPANYKPLLKARS